MTAQPQVIDPIATRQEGRGPRPGDGRRAVIPRRIIHIYSVPEGQPEELPLVCQAAMANAKLLNPGFEHVLFSRTKMQSFLETEFPEFQQAIRAFRFPIQRFDFFRYLAVYRLGGFYFDLDLFLARALDPLLECGCVFAFEELTISRFLRSEFKMDWELANYGFGAAAGHPFIGAIIENCVRGLKDPVWAAQLMQGIPGWFQNQFFVPMTTGPGMVSRTFAENRQRHRDITVLVPNDVCVPGAAQRFGDFGVHLVQASWRKRDGFLRRQLARRWEIRTRRQQLRQSQAAGPVRPGEWHSRLPGV